MPQDYTPSEKKIARRLFELAAKNAENDYLQRHKEKELTTLEDLWSYEREIREWRKDYDRFFQFRYSTLDITLIASLNHGWLTLNDLSELSEERVARIKGILDI